MAACLAVFTVGISSTKTVNAACLYPNGNVHKGFGARTFSTPVLVVRTSLNKKDPNLSCTTHPSSFTLESIMIVADHPNSPTPDAWVQLGWTRSTSTQINNTNITYFWVQIQPRGQPNLDYYFEAASNATFSIEREWDTQLAKWMWVSRINGVYKNAVSAQYLTGNAQGLDVKRTQVFGETSFNDNQMGGSKTSPAEFNLLEWKLNSSSWSYIQSANSIYTTWAIDETSRVYKNNILQYTDNTWRIRNWTERKTYLPFTRK